MNLEHYLQNIKQSYKSGIATEHTYRGDLKQLLEMLLPNISVTNEPKRIKCGAPDYVLTKDDVPIGFIEAKDIGDKDLSGAKKTGNKEQFDRYKSSLNNLIFTDYLDFHLYIDGILKTSIKIAEIEDGEIIPLTENFPAFTNLIKDFATNVSQTIVSSKRLAEMMAGKARMLSDVVEKALLSDEENDADSTLKEQMKAFKDILIHDITAKGFADVYAQTIAYGMFAARLHDVSLNTFTRQEAAELIPKTNPFLRKLFIYIAGPDIDDRIKWIVDSLADIFRATDVEALLKNFGKSTQTHDPIIHFYETFLSEYDPKLRKARGVWYTPEPVVNFIVRAVDDILKSDFNLPQGLADTSKTKIKVKTQSKDKRFAEGVKDYEKEVHKVQILDPATGTGTFLAEVIKHIHNKFANQQGIWSNYVENHLIPRLNGFELLMASYAMAHLKLDMLLAETGYNPTKDQRLNIYLTNSLEEHHPDTGTLWANWLSSEANEANYIKRDTPVMCVIGNPPYSVSSSNKSKWIEILMNDYKKDLNERNIQPLSDDYIKFIRFGQHFIDKNGEGILAYISNNSFIDGLIHRQMRKNLLESFDKIYILDLHGNAKKKEVCPDGSPDQNVFDIMQGVSINIFIKTSKNKKKDELGKVFHFDSFGKREIKYNFLNDNSIKTVDWNELELRTPELFLVKKDFNIFNFYENGFKVDNLFPLLSSGIKTHRDHFVIDFDRKNLANRISKFYDKTYSDAVIASEMELKSNRDWDLSNARNKGSFEKDKIQPITYRPFDNRPIYYDSNLIDFGREKTIYHLQKENLGLVLVVQPQAANLLYFDCLFITDTLTDTNMFRRGGPVSFPLYLYPEDDEQVDMFASERDSRIPNLNLEIVNQIAERLGIEFVNEKETTPAPPFKGGEFAETTTQSSPPVLGGVDVLHGRGGNSLSSSEVDENQDGNSLSSSEVEDRASNSQKINNLPYLKTFRKELRNNLTPAEAKFWKIVQNSNFEGRKFRRQHSVGNYILDFYCPSEKLAIELDGEVHFNDKAREYDYERKLFLEHYGIKVLRFENKRVFEDLEWMLDVIKSNFGWNKKLNTTDDKEVQPPRPADTPPFKGGELLSSESVSLPKEGELLSFKTGSPPKGGELLSSEPVSLPKEGELLSFKTVSPPKEGELLFPKTFAPIDILDYIYAVLHSPAYREKYKEFLKIDFPRVPYPKDKETFWKLVALGGEIRQIHLLESQTVEQYITQYPMDGDNIVGKIRYEDGKVWINEAQYFANVPNVAWEFYIGGYQPAQKWLKDRKDRALSFDDIFHYQKIIVALTETDRLMKEIDKIEIE